MRFSKTNEIKIINFRLRFSRAWRKVKSKRRKNKINKTFKQN